MSKPYIYDIYFNYRVYVYQLVHSLYIIVYVCFICLFFGVFCTIYIFINV